jgi:hypothetical protein
MVTSGNANTPSYQMGVTFIEKMKGMQMLSHMLLREGRAGHGRGMKNAP